jgi:hypothetical protein
LLENQGEERENSEEKKKKRKINIYVPPLNTCAVTLARAC